MTRAKLVFKEKLVLQSGLVREGIIWKVADRHKYPDGVRYRLALVNPESGEVLVLFDNHYPKGHHRHIRDHEDSYEFKSVEQLVDDFLTECRKEEAKL